MPLHVDGVRVGFKGLEKVPCVSGK